MLVGNLVPVWRNRALGLALAIASAPAGAEPLAGGSLDPTRVPKYVVPMIIPPEIPNAGTVDEPDGKKIPHYEIEAVEFYQQILPVRGRGSLRTRAGRGRNPPLGARYLTKSWVVGHCRKRSFSCLSSPS
jgi:hypothetical protein